MRDERAGPLFCHLTDISIAGSSRRSTPARSTCSARRQSRRGRSPQGRAPSGEIRGRRCGRGGRAPPRHGRCGLIGTPAAVDALRDPSARGSWGVRTAARAELGASGMTSTPRAPRFTRTCCGASLPACARRSSTRPTTARRSQHGRAAHRPAAAAPSAAVARHRHCRHRTWSSDTPMTKASAGMAELIAGSRITCRTDRLRARRHAGRAVTLCRNSPGLADGPRSTPRRSFERARPDRPAQRGRAQG